MENYEFPQIDEMIEEEEKKDPLQEIIDLYKETVEEKDLLGFEDIYKTETERFFVTLDKYLKEHYDLSFTPHDIEYGDGYFLFGRGTNSTISFHIKEAPGWLFGIWWSPVVVDATAEDKRYYKDRIKCEFFVQYEETIDKFKPSASMFETYFIWNFSDSNENFYSQCYKATHVILLILQYPKVAFVREVCWQDLNVEYITLEQADQFYTEWHLKEQAKKLMEQANAKAMLDCLTYIYKDFIDSGDAYIEDSGPNVSPRYDLIMRNIWKDDQGQEESHDGCFNLFDWGADWDDKEEDMALWNKTLAECNARADALQVYWFNPIARWINIRSGDKYWKLKREYEEKKHD